MMKRRFGLGVLLLMICAQVTYAANAPKDLTAGDIAPGKVQLSVIGAGSLGGAVGAAWVKAGYDVMLSSRHPDELEPMARRLGPNARVGTPEQAARYGQVVLLAVPYTAIPQVSRDFDEQLQGKILLDATNAWGAEDSPIGQQAAQAGDGVVSRRYFEGVRLVRAFSAVDASVIRAARSCIQPAGR